MNNLSGLDQYEVLAKKVRLKILDLIYTTKSPHIGPSFSCVEILVSLYFKILSIDPNNSCYLNRDRFVFSKGHACVTLYAALYEKGFLTDLDLDGFAKDGGSLEHHPNLDVSKGIEVSSGSLGHGLSLGTGMALASKKDKNYNYNTYVLLSDGELNEGSTWEAVMFAAQHELSNLITIVDYNKMQALGFTKDTINLEPMVDKWKAFNWNVIEVDGHNFDSIFNGFSNIDTTTKRPTVIIAHTIKGKGISFMENELLWHYRAPDDKEYRLAKEELLNAR